MTAFSPAQSTPLVSTPMVLPEFTITSGTAMVCPIFARHWVAAPLISPDCAYDPAGAPGAKPGCATSARRGPGPPRMTNANNYGFISRTATERCLRETIGTGRLPELAGYIVPAGSVARQPSGL